LELRLLSQRGQAAPDALLVDEADNRRIDGLR
jgi:hypothetical protein